MTTRWLGAPGVVRGRRIALPQGIVPASLHLAGGRVMRVSAIDDIGDAFPSEVLDADDLVVMPGLVDTHVHLNEPGRADWEGFATGTAAAAAGGVTTVLDMPLNSIPATTKLKALEKKRASAAGQCRVDVGFLAGLVPGNLGDLAQLWGDGVFGFKCFLVPSGVKEFRDITPSALRASMPALAGLHAPILVHAELPESIDAAAKELRGRDPSAYATYLASRPAAAEVQAVQLIVDLARRFAVHMHVVHVSAAEALPILRDARRSHVPVTAETCPHYLTFAAEEVPAGATEFKCAPPIRESANRDALWGGLLDGTLQCVVSDHSPCPPALKRRDKAGGDFLDAWGGIGSLELGLSAIATALHARSLPLDHAVRWMCERPAQLVGLHRNKGRLAAGYQGDFVLFDPDERWEVAADQLHQRHHITPYIGRSLRGRVKATYLRGRLIYADGATVGAPSGRMLRREAGAVRADAVA